jgi:hypothetical protein
MLRIHVLKKSEQGASMTDIIALLEQACGGRCNAENNPCEYKEAARKLEGLKPVAWRKKANGVWHYFDESTPFPFDDCEPLYEKN